MSEFPTQLIRQPVTESGKETSATTQDYISHENLVQIWIAWSKGFTDQLRNCSRQIWVSRLGKHERHRHGLGYKRTSICEVWWKNCSPIPKRSGPKYML
jgi:hypothetical protein